MLSTNAYQLGYTAGLAGESFPGWKVPPAERGEVNRGYRAGQLASSFTVQKPATTPSKPTRKRKAKPAPEVPPAPEPPRKCLLCDCTEHTKSVVNRRGYRQQETEPITGRYCDDCERGMLSGRYAAVGVQHEIALMKRCKGFTESRPMTLDKLAKVHGFVLPVATE